MAPTTANWHWKNKHVTPWAKQWFERELTALVLKGDSGEEVSISEVTDVDGDVELGQRKSKYVLRPETRVHDLGNILECLTGLLQSTIARSSSNGLERRPMALRLLADCPSQRFRMRSRLTVSRNMWYVLVHCLIFCIPHVICPSVELQPHYRT